MRWLLSAAASLLGIVLGLYPLTLAPPITPLIIMAVVALTLLGLALSTAWWLFAGPCVAILILEYASALVLASGNVDLLSPAVAVGYLVLLELIDAVRALVRQAPVRRSVLKKMGNDTVPAIVIGAIGAFCALLASSIVSGGHPLLLAIAAAAGLGAVAFAVALARRALSTS